MQKFKNHYKTLGISAVAARREIVKARNALLKNWHPDLNPENAQAAKEMTVEILMAAEVLLDEKSRAEYDKVYFLHYGKPAAPRPAPAAKDKKAAWTRPGQKKTARIVVCPECGRKNVNPMVNNCIYCDAAIAGGAAATVACPECGRANAKGRNYCMYCGAGIGDNPRPFHFSDMDMNLYKEMLTRKYKEEYTDSILHFVLKVIFCLYIFSIVKLVFFNTNVLFNRFDRQSYFITLAMLLGMAVLMVFYFRWYNRNIRK